MSAVPNIPKPAAKPKPKPVDVSVTPIDLLPELQPDLQKLASLKAELDQAEAAFATAEQEALPGPLAAKLVQQTSDTNKAIDQMVATRERLLATLEVANARVSLLQAATKEQSARVEVARSRAVLALEREHGQRYLSMMASVQDSLERALSTYHSAVSLRAQLESAIGRSPRVHELGFSQSVLSALDRVRETWRPILESETK